MRKVKILGRRRLLDGFFKVDEVELRHQRFDGTMSPPLRRLVLERGDSVAALVHDVDRDELLLTEQFRLPAHAKGAGWMLEVMAGMIDRGETPRAALRRELVEELGYAPTRIAPIATFFVSPGGSSERIFLFYATVRAASRVAAGGGLATEHEDIRRVALSGAKARRLMARGAIVDAKTLVALQWFFSRPPRPARARGRARARAT